MRVLLWPVLCSFTPGTENEDAEREYQNDNQASWVHRMLMALVSDSALFNTREGRAGKVHNFMLGLNLNTSYPLSPLRDLSPQDSFDDDELDAAVAGIHWREASGANSGRLYFTLSFLGEKHFNSH